MKNVLSKGICRDLSGNKYAVRNQSAFFDMIAKQINLLSCLSAYKKTPANCRCFFICCLAGIVTQFCKIKLSIEFAPQDPDCFLSASCVLVKSACSYSLSGLHLPQQFHLPTTASIASLCPIFSNRRQGIFRPEQALPTIQSLHCKRLLTVNRAIVPYRFRPFRPSQAL